MQYSWHFQYSSTLINLGRDNMFSLVSLFFSFFFYMSSFLVLQPVFSCVGVTKAWQQLLLVSVTSREVLPKKKKSYLGIKWVP